MREKAEGAKAYIERKYAKLKNEEKEKKEAWDKLLKQMDKMNLTAYQTRDLAQRSGAFQVISSQDHRERF